MTWLLCVDFSSHKITEWKITGRSLEEFLTSPSILDVPGHVFFMREEDSSSCIVCAGLEFLFHFVNSDIQFVNKNTF